MKSFSAAALWLTIVASILVMWVKAKWATTIPEVAACTLATIWMISFLPGRTKPRLSAALIPMAGILVWAGAQIFFGTSVYPWQTEMSILYWACGFAMFFAGLQTFADPVLRARFLRALLLFGFVISVISPLQAFTANAKIFWTFQTDYTSWLVFGPFVYTNQYAAFIELLLPVALYGALMNSRWRIVDTLIAAVMYTSVVASASRGGVVLTTAEVIFVPLMVAHRFKRKAGGIARTIGALTGMSVLLIVAAGPGLLMAKFQQHDPYAMRGEFLSSSFKMIAAKPVTGVGLGNWATAYPKYAVFDDGLFTNQAHNDWAQWTVEGGLPMTALMLWLAGWGIRRGFSVIWGTGIAAVFLHCLIDYPIQRTGVALVLFVLMAAAAYPDKPQLFAAAEDR